MDKKYTDKDWLYQEYVIKKRSAIDIARECEVPSQYVDYFRNKFGFERNAKWGERLKKEKIKIKCSNPDCDKIIYIWPCHLKQHQNGIGKCCSYHCSGVLKAKLRINHFCTPETNPGWKGGIHKIRRSYTKYRKDYCEICGKKIDEIKQMDVHHLIPYQLTKDNSEDNLMTLCENCHHKVEQNLAISYLFTELLKYKSQSEIIQELRAYIKASTTV